MNWIMDNGEDPKIQYSGISKKLSQKIVDMIWKELTRGQE